MLTHVVLIRFKADAPAKAKTELVSALRELPAVIEEIQEYRVGLDTVFGPNSADVGLVSAFEDSAALKRYRDHPAHMKVYNERIVPFLEKLTVVDFEE